MDTVIERGGLRDPTSSESRYKAVLLDVTHADPRARVHIRAGVADRDGSAAPTSGVRKRNHHARVGQASSDERRHTFVALAVASYGRLGKEGSEFMDQLAASIVGRTNRGSVARNGVCEEHCFAGHISDCPGRDLAPGPGAPIQACPAKPPGRQEEKEGGWRITLSCRWGVRTPANTCINT